MRVLTNCIRILKDVRSAQSKHAALLVVPARQESKWNWRYSSKEGVPREVITMLTQDYDFSWKGIKAYLESSRWMAVKEDHKFVPERHRVLGPDLAAAHFLVKRGARVKFWGRNMWFQRDEEGKMYLPNQMVPGLHLEAIDCTGMQMSYVAFDNMIHLEKLRYLNLSRCINLDDWCLAKLYQFQHSLEFLDLTGCWEVTEHGLACLHTLKQLKGLKVTGLSCVRNMPLIVLLLEEALPDLTVFGLDSSTLTQLGTGDTHNPPQLSERLHSITAGKEGGEGESADESTSGERKGVGS